jgi:hypothetical protein
LPLISGLLDQPSHAKVYTEINLHGAYNLVCIRESDEWKVTFKTHYGHFEICYDVATKTRVRKSAGQERSPWVWKVWEWTLTLPNELPFWELESRWTPETS